MWKISGDMKELTLQFFSYSTGACTFHFRSRHLTFVVFQKPAMIIFKMLKNLVQCVIEELLASIYFKVHQIFFMHLRFVIMHILAHIKSIFWNKRNLCVESEDVLSQSFMSNSKPFDNPDEFLIKV